MTIRLHRCRDTDATLLPKGCNRRFQNVCQDDDDVICTVLVLLPFVRVRAHCAADASNAVGVPPLPVCFGEKRALLS